MTIGKRPHLRLALLTCALLSGCAAQQLHKDGMADLNGGQVEEGLKKLELASAGEPGVASYRTDYLRSRERVTYRLLLTAGSERAAGHGDAARGLYEKILRIDPGNARARQGLELLTMDQRHDKILAEAEGLTRKGELAAARVVLAPVLEEDAKNGRALMLQRQIEEQLVRQQTSEPRLLAQFAKPVTLQFRDANLKMVFEALSRTSGINVLLDRDVKPDLKTSIFVKDVSVEDAINLIMLQNQLEKKVISDNTVFIYPNTPTKQKDYQDLKVKSFHLTHADPKQILAMLKGLLKTKDIFIHEKTNSVVMRDTPDAIRLAEKMIADQDIAEPEVMLEVEVLEVSRTRLSQLGITWPDTIGVKTPAGITTVSDLRGIHGVGALNVTGLPLAATLDFHLDDSEANILASPRIRVRNREKAKIMIGDRLPVITNSVTPVASGTSVVTGSVSYLDVGLKLDVEPDIHLDNEVVIKVSLDVSTAGSPVVTGDASGNGTVAYPVNTRNATTVLRLKDGETQVLGGLINDEDRKSASKIPGLGNIPLLGRLFSDHTDNGKKTEIVLAITPHIVGTTRLPDAGNEEYWTGTDATLRSTPFNMKPLGSVSMSSGNGAAPALSPGPRASPYAPSRRESPGSGALVAPFTLSLDGPAQARPGDLVSVTLNAQSGQVVSGMKLQLNYDPKVFKVLGVEQGDFLKQSPMPSTLNKNVDAGSGQLQMDLSTTGGDGVSGSGSVASVQFEALAANPGSAIRLTRVVPSKPNGASLAASLPEPLVIAVAP
jgi:general secretion pathway protein D